MAELIASRRASRDHNLAILRRAGFEPAAWLPLREHHAQLRPTEEIVARLMAVGALIAWASGDEARAPSRAVEAHVERSALEAALTEGEREVLGLPRTEAREAYAEAIGWHMSELWSLGWILGVDPPPAFDGSAPSQEVSLELLLFSQRGLDASVEGFVSRVELRPVAEVVVVEDLFVCVHHAALRAALGEATARAGFAPEVAGAAIQARRHALTWSLSPSVSWEETDLGT